MTRAWQILVVGLVGAGLSTGCARQLALRTEVLAKESDELKREHQRLLAKINELEHQVAVLEEGVRKPEGEALPTEALAPDPESDMPVEIPVIRLKPQLASAPAKRAPQKVPRHAGKVGKADLTKRYEELFNRFQTADCQEVVLDFDQFSKTHRESELADNAQYWIGECFYRMEEYKLAIEEFRKVPSQFPKGNKVPDAWLRIAMSQTALGNGIDARRTYEKLVRDFPRSEAAQKAAKELGGTSQYGG